MLSFGLLLIRLIIGLIFAGHGAQKLFGWFGGHGLKGAGAWMESVGIKPGVPAAAAAGWIEFAGGLAFAAGLFTPVIAILLALTMVMAIIKVHGRNGFWAASNGYEPNVILIAVFVGIAFTGAGSYSIDALL
ncbi:DoxX family protein [Paenibacillus physcomitrellae]|uniref:Oxidoreductase n=1 Tax=Paenibacillus physcomitrellae TaxID=1619311 RepID=A0ABQ1FRT5_9BACL|nr:DoxX family protein [Paenibacillus physcomitrellae]GGA26848.1 oxidoreductase [Paenibacillus physcomitrellae]